MKYSSFFKAAAGVALAAMVLSCGPKKLSDKEILTLIYNSTGGAEWSEYNQDGWLVEEDLADWHGVKVNEEGRVIELSLSEAQGPIPAEIGGLTELESIYLNVAFGTSRAALSVEARKAPLPGHSLHRRTLRSPLT